SKYTQARSYFVMNARERPGDPRSEFYVFQGLGFYRYFCGRWHLALRWAERAIRAAVVAGYPYGRVLAADLMGHLEIQVGSLASGFKRLSDAGALSRKIGNRGVAEAIAISKLGYEAQFGIRAEKSV